MRRGVWLLAAVSVASLSLLFVGQLAAKDRGQNWKEIEPDPAIREWYAKQVMPDATFSPCCGEGDAYYADAFEDKDGRFYAIITDERDDKPLKRFHVDVGTRIEIPKHKFNGQERGPNITGHGIVFLQVEVNGILRVLCYFPPVLT